jgi:hypothetical protein
VTDAVSWAPPCLRLHAGGRATAGSRRIPVVSLRQSRQQVEAAGDLVVVGQGDHRVQEGAAVSIAQRLADQRLAEPVRSQRVEPGRPRVEHRGSSHRCCASRARPAPAEAGSSAAGRQAWTNFSTAASYSSRRCSRLSPRVAASASSAVQQGRRRHPLDVEGEHDGVLSRVERARQVDIGDGCRIAAGVPQDEMRGKFTADEDRGMAGLMENQARCRSGRVQGHRARGWDLGPRHDQLQAWTHHRTIGKAWRQRPLRCRRPRQTSSP